MFQRSSRAGDAGVVNQNVNLIQFGVHLLNRRKDLFFVRAVRNDRNSTPPATLHLSGRGVDFVLLRRENNDIGSLFRERQRPMFRPPPVTIATESFKVIGRHSLLGAAGISFKVFFRLIAVYSGVSLNGSGDAPRSVRMSW